MKSTSRIALVAVFAAIVIAQNVVPLIGGVDLGPFKITLIHVTVAVAAIVLGPKLGALIGGFWGVTSLINAYVAPTGFAALVFSNPLIAIVPRVLVGVVAGYLFLWLNKRLPATLSAGLAGLAGALTNTVLVLGGIYVLYNHGASIAYDVSVDRLAPFLLGVVVSNGFPEAIAAAILVPAIGLPMKRLLTK